MQRFGGCGCTYRIQERVEIGFRLARWAACRASLALRSCSGVVLMRKDPFVVLVTRVALRHAQAVGIF